MSGNFPFSLVLGMAEMYKCMLMKLKYKKNKNYQRKEINYNIYLINQ